MQFGWYRVFWQDKNFYITYSGRNRGIAAVCFVLLLAIFIFFSGSAVLFNPISLFFFGVVEIFLFVMFSLVDTFVFDFRTKKISHSFGFLVLVRKRSIKFSEIRSIDVRQVVKERFIDALQTEDRRRNRKAYQLNFTTKNGVNYQVGYFDETKFRALLRVSEDVRKG